MLQVQRFYSLRQRGSEERGRDTFVSLFFFFSPSLSLSFSLSLTIEADAAVVRVDALACFQDFLFQLYFSGANIYSLGFYGNLMRQFRAAHKYFAPRVSHRDGYART